VKKKNLQPSRRQSTVLRQLVELIPAHLVPKLARKHGVEKQARTFSPFSHVVALLHAQLSHALSLNDVCDGLTTMATPLRALRGATPPSRNALSHANRTRDCAMGEELFWETLRSLQTQFPQFGAGAAPRYAHRFRRSIHIVDATVVQLVASCVDWANHNRRKAAVKCHTRLCLRSLLPAFAIIDSAREHDVQRARQLCAGLQRGEIVLFDCGYHELEHYGELTQRGVFFVTLARENVTSRCLRRRPLGSDPRILADEEVRLGGPRYVGKYPGRLRRVTARVLVDGQERDLTFITNNFTWSAGSVADLYRCRWQIEAFFKQVKQTLQVGDFLGHNANAVKWQLWMALLVYVLLRFQAWRSKWAHSFARLFTLLRTALWLPRDVLTLLRRCGTAEGNLGLLDPPRQSWLPGFIF
jgi:hypothetical protein